MAAMCLKKILHQSVRNEASITRYFARFMVQPAKWTISSHSWVDRAKKGLISAPGQAFCTYEDAEDEPKGKKQNPNARKTVGSVGRKIPHRIIQLIGENGENQGTMHRADVIRILNERGLKLVPLKEAADPPVYKLMSGQQIHEERMKLREKQKASSKTGLRRIRALAAEQHPLNTNKKLFRLFEALCESFTNDTESCWHSDRPSLLLGTIQEVAIMNLSKGPIQQKELTFSTAIGQHDLDTKIKQIEQWIEKKHHVRITLHQKNIVEGPDKMLKFFDQILEMMPEKATYLSEPRIVKEGRSTCVLRHMSNKEIQQHKKMEKDKAQTDGRNETTDSDILKQ